MGKANASANLAETAQAAQPASLGQPSPINQPTPETSLDVGAFAAHGKLLLDCCNRYSFNCFLPLPNGSASVLFSFRVLRPPNCLEQQVRTLLPGFVLQAIRRRPVARVGLAGYLVART